MKIWQITHTHTLTHPTSSDKCIQLINPFDYHMNCLETSTNTWLCRVLLYMYMYFRHSPTHTHTHMWCVHLPMCARKIYSTVVMCLSFVVLSLLPCKCVYRMYDILSSSMYVFTLPGPFSLHTYIFIFNKVQLHFPLFLPLCVYFVFPKIDKRNFSFLVSVTISMEKAVFWSSLTQEQFWLLFFSLLAWHGMVSLIIGLCLC